jgi:hypothetical protein
VRHAPRFGYLAASQTEEARCELKIWMNGRLVPQAEANTVSSAAVLCTNVLEGLRAYWNDTDEELYCFRLETSWGSASR